MTVSPEAGRVQEATGMWAPYEPAPIGEPLELLEQAGEFVLVDARVRESVVTQYGPRDAVDLIVATTEPGVTRIASGFAAGIVGQAKRKGPNDLPAIAKVVSQETARGTTRALEMIGTIEPGTGERALAEIAATLSVPIRPVNLAANGQGRPAGDDGVPY